MNIKEAYYIFQNIECDGYTDEEKGEAIMDVLQMVTHNGITKKQMLKVIWWLLGFVFEIPEGTEPPKNYD